MWFGVQFFPDVRPEEKSAEAYFREALDLAEEGDRLRFQPYPHRRALLPFLRRLQPEPDRLSRRGGAAHAPGTARHRRCPARSITR